ncbi:macrophage colony-stimulating factor 1 receptor [Sardina pilchardus]|uniref:macrophage colony-stimulating factor 1 receptor n=1 Tax=Sardina pilchardus TaxID=27697 RepID=UPI002E0D80B0
MLYLLLMMAIVPCVPQDVRPPVIQRSSLTSDSDLVLTLGSPLLLHCHGDAVVTWQPRLAKHRKFISKGVGRSRTFRVGRAEAEHTGTYKCVYTNASLTHLYSSVHVYVRDPAVAFVVSSNALRVVRKEGESCTLACLITDPTLAPVSLRLANGSAPPPDLNFTSDPHRGVKLLKLRHGHTGDYVCAAHTSGQQEIFSKTFSLNVIQRLQAPPYVFLKQTEYVRIIGEELKISCTTHNPNFYYNVTWIHNSSHALRVEENVQSKGSQLDIESTFTIPAVTPEDSGNITCVGTNEAGINSSSTRLQVIKEAYVRVRVASPWELDGGRLEVSEGEDVQVQLMIDAYPALTSHTWTTPYNTTLEQHLYRHGPYRWEASLLLRRVNYQEQGLYTFTALSSKANTSISFTLLMFQRPVVVVSRDNTSALTCVSKGYPAPTILWYQCSGIHASCAENITDTESLSQIRAESVEVERAEFGSESKLLIGQADQHITIECVASNAVGHSRAVFAMEVPDKRFSTYLAGGAGVVAFLILLLLILLYKYKQKPRYEIRWKIVEATNGNNYTFIDPSQLPYNEKWEFPRDKLRLGKTLGAGAFGKVVEATAYGMGKEDNVTRVAVKMLKGTAHIDEKEALMSELKILSHLGQHKNIVNLLGACTHGGPVLVITEYCCHGDLLNFLRGKAESFLSVVLSLPPATEDTSDYKNLLGGHKFIRSDSGISSTCSDSYLDMRPVPGPAGSQALSCQHGDSWPVDMDDLLRFSLQVAQGLEFLADQNCIHRDVAARNVLLAEGRVAKICDFGLARDIMNDSNYVVKGNARLPVKWMAPESIFECVYTVQSDVWSYGILLWEIFSLGKSPYPSILVDSKFYKMIKCGYQMQRPDFSPPEMYSIMRMCWTLEPTERPTFSKICSMIQRLLGEEVEPDTTGTYQNTEQLKQEEALGSCEQLKCTEESCDQSCDQSHDAEQEEEQPLMKTNNYQFC